MPQVLLFAIGVSLLTAVFFIFRGIHRSGARRDEAAQFAAARSWEGVEKIGDLITLYLDMAIKHGPNSAEAKAFRFGVANSEVWRSNSEAMATFEKIVEHFDDALKRNRKQFRWS